MEADAYDSSVPSYPQHKLLLCEDSAAERRALALFLRRHGFDVIEASDGATAMEYLKNEEINVILLDLQMPDVDGFDVLGYLQQHRRGLPVVLLSGMPLDEIQHKIHGLPTKELPPLLIKPVNLDQLLQLLELQLSGAMPDLDTPTADAPDTKV